MNALNKIETQTAPITAVPVWADEYLTESTTMDITDNWREETGDDGSIATAHFEENRDMCGDTYQTLLGIKVDDGHGAVFYDADRATDFLTLQVVIRLESGQAEAMA